MTGFFQGFIVGSPLEVYLDLFENRLVGYSKI